MDDLPILYIRQGDIYFGDFDGEIRTNLGSCVSVVLLHKNKYLGGMCHIVLPENLNPDKNCDNRYANCAIAEFVKRIHKSGTKPGDYWTGVYGGGNMFPVLNNTEEYSIGIQNIKKVFEQLKQNGFHISNRAIGGNVRRKLSLKIHTGEVQIIDTDMEF